MRKSNRMLLPKPGGDEPRFVVPDSAGDKLLAGASSAELSLYREYGDDGRPAVGIQIRLTANVAAAEIASEIKRLVDEIKGKQREAKVGGSVPITRPTGELATLLSATYPRTKLSEMVLAPEQRESLELVIREYRQRSKLREHGRSARRKLLLVGPPGVGKTMTSWALAGELKLPHFTRHSRANSRTT